MSLPCTKTWKQKGTGRLWRQLPSPKCEKHCSKFVCLPNRLSLAASVPRDLWKDGQVRAPLCCLGQKVELVACSPVAKKIRKEDSFFFLNTSPEVLSLWLVKKRSLWNLPGPRLPLPVTRLILPEVIRLFQGLSHACARHNPTRQQMGNHLLEGDSVDGSLLRLL